ncbi:MAG: hypothetical protein KC416_15645 [Myxococcales bacterium]|nr:hypothetical protein [Myxococcales bacterium]
MRSWVTRSTLLVVLPLLLSACTEEKVSPAEKAPQPPQATQAPDEVAKKEPPPTPAEVPIPEDFEGAAARDIEPNGYRESLDAIEAELEGTP